MSNPDRYIVAFAPNASSLLWSLGARWFGYDAASKRPSAEVATFGLPAKIHTTTISSVRRSGFNLPVSGPFQLHRSVSQEDLLNYAEAFSETLTSVNSGKLLIRAINTRLVMEPMSTPPAIRSIADDCVRFFNKFRMPGKPLPGNSPVRKSLSSRQLDHYLKWGQPYVFDEFRPQIPLTGLLPEKAVNPLGKQLALHFGNALNAGLLVDNISIFCQPANLDPARLIGQFHFPDQQVDEPAPTLAPQVAVGS